MQFVSICLSAIEGRLYCLMHCRACGPWPPRCTLDDKLKDWTAVGDCRLLTGLPYPQCRPSDRSDKLTDMCDICTKIVNRCRLLAVYLDYGAILDEKQLKGETATTSVTVQHVLASRIMKLNKYVPLPLYGNHACMFKELRYPQDPNKTKYL